MNGHVPLVLAAGPHINPSSFNAWPPLAVVFIVSLLSGAFFAFMGRRVSMASQPTLNVLYGVLALLSVTTAITALSFTGLAQGFFQIIRNIEGGIGIGIDKQGPSLTAAGIGTLLCALAAWWYIVKERLIAAVVFALLAIVLAGASVSANNALSWYANTIVAFFNNLGAGMANSIFS